MSEIERAKMSKDNKTMTALFAPTMRDIVRNANEEGIKREDIVSLLKENGQFILVYFR